MDERPNSEEGTPVRTKKRGVIISNCQSQPIMHTLSLFCRDIAFTDFGVHFIPPEERQKGISDFVERAKDEYDVILPIPLSDEFGPLSRERIKDTFRGKRVGVITNFYFSGLHPDLTYIGGLSRRIGGALGDYHSKIALMGYLHGLPADSTLALYCDETYQELGYYDEYEESLAELRRRESEVDIPFADEMAALIPQDLCFFSVNHPTSFLIAAYAEKIAGWLEEKGVSERTDCPRNPVYFVNYLASTGIFPVYPEIASRFGLNYSGSYLFKPLTPGNNPVCHLDLAEFVEEEYAAYGAFSYEEIANSHQGRALMQRYADFPGLPHHSVQPVAA